MVGILVQPNRLPFKIECYGLQVKLYNSRICGHCNNCKPDVPLRQGVIEIHSQATGLQLRSIYIIRVNYLTLSYVCMYVFLLYPCQQTKEINTNCTHKRQGISAKRESKQLHL